jgi:hypothetical protein
MQAAVVVGHNLERQQALVDQAAAEQVVKEVQTRQMELQTQVVEVVVLENLEALVGILVMVVQALSSLVILAHNKQVVER